MGSALQRQPVSERSWAVHCQWQSEGCWFQVGWRANAPWLLMRGSTSLSVSTQCPCLCQGSTQTSPRSRSRSEGSLRLWWLKLMSFYRTCPEFWLKCNNDLLCSHSNWNNLYVFSYLFDKIIFIRCINTEITEIQRVLWPNCELSFFFYFTKNTNNRVSVQKRLQVAAVFTSYILSDIKRSTADLHSFCLNRFWRVLTASPGDISNACSTRDELSVQFKFRRRQRRVCATWDVKSFKHLQRQTATDKKLLSTLLGRLTVFFGNVITRLCKGPHLLMLHDHFYRYIILLEKKSHLLLHMLFDFISVSNTQSFQAIAVYTWRVPPQ